MRRSLIFVLAFLSATLIISSTIAASHASVYSKVGVSEGDTEDYWVSELSHYYVANYSTGEPVYSYFKITGEYDGFHLHLIVTHIEGTNVTVSITCYYPNGTQYENKIITVDVSTGTLLTPPSGSLLIPWTRVYLVTASNLEPGDPIYPSSNIIIDESLNMIIGGEYRLVNHVKFSETTFPSSTYYWDKESGLLLEYDSAIMSLVDGVKWGATVIRWFNVSTTPRNTNPTDTTGETLVLLAGVSIAVAVMALFTAVDRRRRS